MTHSQYWLSFEKIDGLHWVHSTQPKLYASFLPICTAIVSKQFKRVYGFIKFQGQKNASTMFLPRNFSSIRFHNIICEYKVRDSVATLSVICFPEQRCLGAMNETPLFSWATWTHRSEFAQGKFKVDGIIKMIETMYIYTAICKTWHFSFKMLIV